MAKLEGRAIKRKYIELYGILGEFDLKSKDFIVKYFSTLASSKNIGSDNFELLSELKPMRETVKASKLKDLDSLLQRNLNDFRVANELIPYLTEKFPPISFFPAILCVLIPHNFLVEEEEHIYPIPKHVKEKNKNPKISYNDLWQVELFELDGQISHLGILMLDLKQVDIVVLDGQHRANAFRVLSNTFSKTDGIYKAFYDEVKELSNFEADLPVTLIWFESKNGPVDPRFISRRLFVDVNNTARWVSKSRTILLDEFEIASLQTRFLYSYIAENYSFGTENFSLLHSGFDFDSDLSSSVDNIFTLTNPEVVHYVFSWLTLGPKKYNGLDYYSVSRERFRDNTISFNDIYYSDKFNSTDIDPWYEAVDGRQVVIKELNKKEVFKEEYLKRLNSVLYNVYNKFSLFKPHYQACKNIEVYYEEEMNTKQREAWDEVFVGGEGLYYSLRDLEKKEKYSKRIENYLKAIDEIEDMFSENRQSYFEPAIRDNVNQAFKTVKSKAFQVGLLMALDVFREGDSLINTYEKFISKINDIDISDWIIVLTKIKSKVISGVDPKVWPSFQKLILRVIQDESLVYYDSENFLDSPDGHIFSDLVEKSLNSWLDTNDEYDIEDLEYENIEGEARKWINSAKKEVDSLFNQANIEPIDVSNLIKVGRGEVEKFINKIKGI